jgi:ATP-binding cassette subfamily F protein 2
LYAAKALFAAPSILLLDEPTNHLDLEACVWLEEHLSTYKKCLLVVSHSEDFLNTVCNNIIWMKPNPNGKMGFVPGVNGHTLKYYNGNYEMFEKVTTDEERYVFFFPFPLPLLLLVVVSFMYIYIF